MTKQEYNPQEIKDKITLLLRSTKREGVENLINWLENKSDFFTSPASTKYHGNYEHQLCVHSYLVYELFCDKLDYYNINLDYDSRIISGLNHDICKCNIYKKGFKNVKNNDTNQWEKKEIWEVDDKVPLGHGEKSVIMLQNFIKLKEEEIYCIRWHMGKTGIYLEDIQFSEAVKKYNSVLLLHTADYESSYLLEEVKD